MIAVADEARLDIIGYSVAPSSDLESSYVRWIIAYAVGRVAG